MFAKIFTCKHYTEHSENHDMEATTSFYLDTRRAKKDDTYPVKLRITFERKTVYYPTKHSLTKENYEKVFSKKPRKPYKDILLELTALENKAIKIIEDIGDFSFELFDRRFSDKSSNLGSVFRAFTEHIDILKEKGNIRNSDIYKSARKSFTDFKDLNSIRFEQITPSFLEDYEKWMRERPRSITTTAMYLRCLRKIFRKAIKDGIVKESRYPFGNREDGKYTIPEPQNIKKALSIPDIKKILEYKAELESVEKYYRDIWVFSYLGNGMNIKDICLLKYKHIDGNSIYFDRAKTVNTNRKSKPIVVPLIAQNKQIIKEWGNKNTMPNSYVFPVLKDGLDAETVEKRIKQFTKQINKYIQRIAKKLKIESHITTYTARHSFATVLKRSGVSTEFISESLGHTNLKTTENYLDSFEDETRLEHIKKLLDF